MSMEYNHDKENFKKWCSKNNIAMDANKLEKLFLEAFPNSKGGLYSVNNSPEAKNNIIEIILKRNKSNAGTVSDYVYLISGTLYYIEYLGDRQLKQNHLEELTEENQQRYSLIVAYFLSRVNNKGLKLLGYKSFTEAFSDFAAILDQKPATIKNMRDEFDPYFDNGRKGWYQRALSKSRQEIFDEFADVPEEKLLAIINKIRDTYPNANEQQEKPSKGCKTIKITSQNMKEKKTKKK